MPLLSPMSASLLTHLVLFLSALLSPAAKTYPIFTDDFSSGHLDTSKWKVATYRSPDSKPGLNDGTYVASAISFDEGMLRIVVKQRKTSSGVDSQGGAIISKERFGFGS